VGSAGPAGHPEGVEPDAVVAFVEGKGATVLSGLSKREALKHIGRRHESKALN
jgi:hypothetical protein